MQIPTAAAVPQTSRQDEAPASDGRHDGIDILRGIAVMGVVLFHCIGMLLWDVSGTPLVVFKAGWVGVDLFFAISGYVITASALRKHAVPGYARSFWTARLARIVPLYYLTAIVFLLLVTSAALDQDAAFQLLSHAFFIHNFFVDAAYSINGPTWSLSIEMQFYLLAFLLVPLVARAGRKTLIAGYAVLFVAVMACRYFVWQALGQAGASDAVLSVALSQAPTLVDSFALGGLIRLLGLAAPAIHSTTRTVLLVLAAFALFLAIYFIYDVYALRYWSFIGTAVFFRSLIAVFAGVALLAALSSPAISRWKWSPLLRIGQVSYGVYLWHWIVLVLVQRYLHASVGVWVIVIIAITIALSELTLRLVELPVMRWSRGAAKPLS
ncbi:MAG: acyltransferase [Betaproteobacteria bacterium]